MAAIYQIGAYALRRRMAREREAAASGGIVLLPVETVLRDQFMRASKTLGDVDIRTVVFASTEARRPMIEAVVANVMRMVDLGPEKKDALSRGACERIEQAYVDLQHPPLNLYGDGNLRACLETGIHNAIVAIARDIEKTMRAQGADVLRLR